MTPAETAATFNTTIINDDTRGEYHFSSADDIIQKALALLDARLRNPNDFRAVDVESTKAFCKLRIAAEDREVFGILFTDNKHRMIAFEVLFSGTIDSANVWPREVVKRALSLNAAAVVFTHNHPSGNNAPSDSDINITKRLASALDLVGVRVLDHIIVGMDAEPRSLREYGISW
jgi:DNA repair protein RadC